MDRITLAKLSLYGSLFALCVIGLGAFTRLIDAGLGCPDWPLCYGQLIVTKGQHQVSGFTTPFVAYKAWAEMIHRYFAGCLSIIVLLVLGLICTKKNRTKLNTFLGITIFLLILYQIVLGQLTVTLKLIPIVVTQHLLGGFFILAILWSLYLNNKSQKPVMQNQLTQQQVKLLSLFTSIAIILLLTQIFLGAWTSTNYASLSCPDFPFCNNDYASNLNFKDAFALHPVGINYEGGILPSTIRQTIQMTHRLGALILSLYLLIFISCAVKNCLSISYLVKLLLIIFGLLIVQVSLGIINVIFALPVVTAVGHNLVAILLLLSLITFLFELIKLRRAALHASFD